MKQIAYWLTIIGGVNWGLVGVGSLIGGVNLNLVQLALGSIPVLENVVYIVVGLSALWLVIDRS